MNIGTKKGVPGFLKGLEKATVTQVRPQLKHTVSPYNITLDTVCVSPRCGRRRPASPRLSSHFSPFAITSSHRTTSQRAPPQPRLSPAPTRPQPRLDPPQPRRAAQMVNDGKMTAEEQKRWKKTYKD